MAKSVIGYVAASIGIQVDVENMTTRMLINFGFSLLNSILLFLINRRLLGLTNFQILWAHELIRAAINTAGRAAHLYVAGSHETPRLKLNRRSTV